ncbi:MAG: threonine ammonia-lyase, biosynthetic [Candidatus Thiodiazotropha sp. (ex Lucinoma kastoroae)]|nr:threonine ammonia-lyase, biosynthetic [Candidatus Thiodiazotropha sp. (ex Rostrolucina anterorostrata)]MCU7846419.1 threonine ammonia-lyase, biosynthetic [Candidatus Thiodiazotropha sp. (ex Lucinoma kastoroae)]MCU7859161.1 threonine ammonia-lyase, biosynthetic [Candidatus Thiodiazotropha sp. (ex Lucinoma kastoroae)]
MPQRYIEKILRARVYDVAKETPLDRANLLSARLDNQIFLKREDLQPVFSFKLRGAYNKMVNLSDDVKKQGVIAASAGNHAQGVALAAQKLKIQALIVMPKTTPPIKVQSVKNLGAKIVLAGDSYDEAYIRSQLIAQEQNLTFIHPFDDAEVIAGQGTIGMELLRQHPSPPEAIFVPVGGGGLIAGIGAYIKYVYPQVKIIGVEPEDAPSLHAALNANRRVKLKQVGIFADGVAVKQVGKETFRLARKVVDEVVLVTTDEICAAIKDIYDDTRTTAEPAGALSVAGMKRYIKREGVTGKQLIAINSGANINFDRLRHVAERAEFGEHREALFAVQIPEQPGSFLKFCKLIGKRSITEFNYRYSDARQAQIFVGIELSNGDEEKKVLFQRFVDKGYSIVDMTDNETAKLHIRYMVGGHAQGLECENLIRFEFPERPGALLYFLGHLGKEWNISLFHYRNHGAAYGRVLMGIQVSNADRSTLHKRLKKLDYPFWDETENPAYRLFAGIV